MELRHTRADFPQGFQFGVATSAYQIEGHGFGGAGQSHWDSFAATPGNVAKGDNGAIGCDHFHRYEEDLDLVAAAGFDVYRFSTSWARLLPEGTGGANPDGIAFYDRLLDAMLERGIKPAATLYHWELPQPLADMGGWRNADMPKWFGEFASLVAHHFGDRLWSTAPINEPWCVAWLSHFMGIHAPGMRDIRAAARAMHHVLVAHGTAIKVMRDVGMTNLGAVCNFEYSLPADDSDEAKLAAARYDAIYNQFFLSGLFKGEYPELVMEGLEPHLPKGWQDDFPTIQAPLDWLGVNYYTCRRHTLDDSLWPSLKEIEGPPPKTEMNWEICPEGLGHFITMAGREYATDIPIYVTENGMACPDRIEGGAVDDPERIGYLNDHLDQVKAAIADGIDLRGYYVWSLLDNYEWALGYDKRFGLVHVDFDTLDRTPKASWHALKSALAGGRP